MTYTPQVDKSHYVGAAYSYQDRWNAYWHQLVLVHRTAPQDLLEVGVGAGIVARELRQVGVAVTTVDIAADLEPDVLGSVTDLPFKDASFDTVLAAEILEHISFDDVPQALHEIARVTKKYAVLSLPYPGYVFSIIFKFPLLSRTEFLLQVPFFWKTHVFNGEHYWELGKKCYPVSRFITAAHEAGLSLVSLEKFADDPAHRFFLFEKTPIHAETV